MRISRKLFIGFSIVIILAFIIGIIGIDGMRKSHKSALSMYEKQVVGLEYAGKANSVFKQIQLDIHKTIVNAFYDDLKGAIDAKKNYEEDVSEFELWMSEINIVTENQEIIKFHDRIMDMFYNIYLPNAVNIIDESIKDIPDHAHKLHINAMFAINTDVSEKIDRLFIGLIDLNTALAEQTNQNDAKTTRGRIKWLSVLLLCSVIAAVIVALYIIRSIANPVNDAVETLAEFSHGNFGARMKGRYKGTFGEFKSSVNNTGQKLALYLSDKMQAEQSAHASELAKARVEAASEAVFAGIDYASRIQKSILPNLQNFKNAFSDYSVIWEPRDVVGGDIYWLKTFAEGSVLCVCDCTGHGTPGALLTMLVISAFDNLIHESNYKDTAEVIWQLEKQLIREQINFPDQSDKKNSTILDIKDGCDLAVLYISNDGEISLSSGNTNVFICDGHEVTRIKGQKISVGEGKLSSKQDIDVINIPANPNNKFYIASDGLYDQMGGKNNRPFGYRSFKNIILDNHNEKQAVISKKIWNAFEEYRGNCNRRDDVQLITFKP